MKSQKLFLCLYIFSIVVPYTCHANPAEREIYTDIKNTISQWFNRRNKEKVKPIIHKTTIQKPFTISTTTKITNNTSITLNISEILHASHSTMELLGEIAIKPIELIYATAKKNKFLLGCLTTLAITHYAKNAIEKLLIYDNSDAITTFGELKKYKTDKDKLNNASNAIKKVTSRYFISKPYSFISRYYFGFIARPLLWLTFCEKYTNRLDILNKLEDQIDLQKKNATNPNNDLDTAINNAIKNLSLSW